MVTLSVIAVLSIIWGIYFITQYYKKQKVIADILDSNNIKPSELISEDCLNLVKNMRTEEGRRYNGFCIQTKNYENIYPGETISETIKHSSRLKFSPNKLEWELIWKLAKKLIGK